MSRILCISIVASIFPTVTIIALFVHWLLMVIWLQMSTKGSNFCNNKIYEFFFYMVFGTVYIFTHVSVNDGRTFCRYIFFYTVLFIENTVATVVWILRADMRMRNTVYFEPIIGINFSSFIVGIIFMVLYYKICHPSTGYINRHSVKR